MKIGIIGSGYVGLVTGACFAHVGHQVTCVDCDEKKVQSLKRGKIPIYEPGLSEIIKENVKSKRMSFSTQISTAVKKCDILFICVPTPSKKNGEADLKYIESVSDSIAKSMSKYLLIVEKSTVPVKTGEWLAKTLKKYAKKYKKKNFAFDVASNPEFLREGCAVDDFLHPDRVVVGVTSQRAEMILRELYKPLKAPMVVTDINSAELIKHASNSFLAMKISFANQLSRICDKVGADVTEVTRGMGMDERIGKSFLRAGIGFGGSCFPKDLRAFLAISETSGERFNLLQEVLDINEALPRYFVDKIKTLQPSLKGKKIAVLGLAFKPDTDDMRCAPSVPVIELLQKEGAKIVAYDPQAVSKARPLLKKVTYADNPYDACKGADLMALVTEWSEFMNLDFEELKKLMKSSMIVDGRNFYDAEDMKKHGFKYLSMGREAVTGESQ